MSPPAYHVVGGYPPSTHDQTRVSVTTASGATYSPARRSSRRPRFSLCSAADEVRDGAAQRRSSGGEVVGSAREIVWSPRQFVGQYRDRSGKPSCRDGPLPSTDSLLPRGLGHVGRPARDTGCAVRAAAADAHRTRVPWSVGRGGACVDPKAGASCTSRSTMRFEVSRTPCRFWSGSSFLPRSLSAPIWRAPANSCSSLSSSG